MLSPTARGYLVEILISGGGLLILLREFLNPTVRAQRKTAALPEWSGTSVDLLTVVFFALGFWFIAGVGSAQVLKAFAMETDHKIIVQSAAAELGLMTGVFVFAAVYPGQLALPRLRWRASLVSGAATFCVAIPIVMAAGLIWTTLLTWLGLPIEKQSAIELFGRTKDVPWEIVLVALAIVLAPIAEELVFRVVLFRYLRTRIPRWIAFLGPALIFAALHQNLASFGQLVALAIVFSFAYERTGQPGTTIVAHALFNLNTVILLLFGIDL